jgi:hypothetical protein
MSRGRRFPEVPLPEVPVKGLVADQGAMSAESGRLATFSQ